MPRPVKAAGASLCTLAAGLLLVLLAACSASAGLAADDARDRADMTAALDASVASWNRGDLKGHVALYDDSVTVMTAAGPRPTVAAIEAAYRGSYFQDGRSLQSLGVEQVSIRRLSHDSTLMTGRFALSGGGLPARSGWFTLVWLRTPQGWRVVHDHTG